MPIAKPGFVLTYFEKIICAVVALGVLAAAVNAVRRAGVVSRVASPESVAADIRAIERKIREPVGTGPPVEPLPDYVEMIRRCMEDCAPPRTMPLHIVQPPRPRTYDPIRVGLYKEFVLEFKVPLDMGSVKVEGPEGILEVVAHPDGEDYKCARVRSSDKEGQGRVVAVSEGLRLEYPVIVDEKVGKTAYPPSKVVADAQQGVVVVRITPNPKNKDEEVEVLRYEVWRRDWADSLGDYRKAGDVAVAAAAGLTGVPGAMYAPTAAPPWATGRATGGAGMGRGIPTGLPTRTRGVTAGDDLPWQDRGVSAGEKYSYKVRTVGSNTYPAAGEFSEAAFVEASSDTDFRFKSSTRERIGFDVAQLSVGGRVITGTFWASPGEEIGGIRQDDVTGQVDNLLTGDVLVAFHRGVIQPARGLISDRVIYADDEGNLLVRWRKETKSDIWDIVDQVGRVPVMGPAGPPTGIPVGRPTGGPPAGRGYARPTGGPRSRR